MLKFNFSFFNKIKYRNNDNRRAIITLKLIKKAWLVHFPYFAYDKYSKKVEDIYNESQKSEISKKDLQLYVMDKLVEED